MTLVPPRPHAPVELPATLQPVNVRLPSLRTVLAVLCVVGLANGRAFTERLRQELARAQRDHTPLCLAYIDLDNFKRVNDAHGHAAGDELLRSIAQAIRETVRASDVAARLGGDEFAVLFVGTRAEAADATAQRLLGCLERITALRPGLNLGASIGMALYPSPASSPEEMIRAADAAMY